MSLGLGLYEVLPLKWKDIDWENLEINVRQGMVDGRIGPVKNEYRDATLPLDPELAEILLSWKRKTEFPKEKDWIFAPPSVAGEKPYFSTWIRKCVHAAAKKAGLGQLLAGEPTKILRHSYRSWLGTTDTPLATIKDLMRHADIRTTFIEYGNGVPEPMRKAHSKVVRMALPA